MERSAEGIFFAARQRRDPAEREAYLEGACGDDLALRAKVEALLEADAEAGSFMRTVAPAPHGADPVLDTASETADGDASPAHHAGTQEQPGEMIGRFKLLEHIGEGGFGSVWMAEQRRPVRRRVALKIIKLGMDTKQVIARFEAERQALAMMDHPNIAKVLDAGSTETGRPFFVMELVRGVPIVEYCDTERLGTPARLELFVKVCRAIQHAHQKGIIHRDIKPSNVLVTLHDGEPVPKVIDFGIAKATSTELTQRTLFTEHRQVVGTPAYMSPEQAEMSGLDIDTRADVYSLGVLLYEMLTGTTPFTADELLSKGFAEMMRIIRESEPPKPSTRLATLGETASRTAERHRVDAKKLGVALRGDLDWIVMKCLEKDRTRRYETASGLAEDIRRHMGDEPVVAGPPGARYRIEKYVKRNKGKVIAGVSISLVTYAAAVVLFVISQWAISERDRAEALVLRERDRSERSLAAMTQMLSQSGVFDMKGMAVGETSRLDLATSDEVYFEVTRHPDGLDSVAPRWIHEGREGDPNDKVVELLSSEAVYWTTLGMEQARSSAEAEAAAREKAERRLELAMRGVAWLSEIAQDTPISDEVAWARARMAAETLYELLRAAPIGDSMRGQAAAFLEDFERADRARAFEENIESILIERATHMDPLSWRAMERRIAQAFGVYRIDLDGQPPEEVADAIRETGEAVRLADALDLWLGTIGQLAMFGEPVMPRDEFDAWVGVLYEVDDDPLRTGIRRLLNLGRPATPSEVDALVEGLDVKAVSPRTLSWIGMLYGVGGADERAAGFLRTALLLHPDDFMLNFDHALGLAYQDDHEGAARYYLRCTALRPESAGIWRSLGNAMRRSGEVDESIPVLRRAVDLEPLHAPSHADLATALAEAGDLEAAADAQRAAIAFLPDGDRRLGEYESQLAEYEASAGRADRAGP